MFDEIAISISKGFSSYLVIVLIVAAILGTVLTGIAAKSFVLKSSQYCAYFGLIMLTNIVAKGARLYSFVAIDNGYYWIVVVLVISSSVLLCIGYGAIAVARSRDIFGNPYGAILAFIPVANIALFVLKSKLDEGLVASQKLPFLLNHGVLIGIVALTASIELGLIWSPKFDYIRSSDALEKSFSEAELGREIRADGLEATLTELASEAQPNQIDESTRLLRLEADGTTIQYIHEVTTDDDTMTDAKIFDLQTQNCTYLGYRKLVELGATIELIFTHGDGREYGFVRISKELCQELGFRMRR